ncbi:MAG: GNAT superfamily N-acetyltransferase [Gammaproteobacteria bacterium]
MCAGIIAQFIENFDEETERCWIAERNGQRMGSALVANAGDNTAQLRLVLVDPRARGHGLGRRLVRECVRHANGKHYRRITLWSHENLHAARRIYASEGFALVSSEPHHSFGHDLVGEQWQRILVQ